ASAPSPDLRLVNVRQPRAVRAAAAGGGGRDDCDLGHAATSSGEVRMTARLIAFQQRVNQVDSNIALDDFRAFMPTHSYIFIPTLQSWTASSINSRIPPQALFDGNGKPILDESGKPK